MLFYHLSTDKCVKIRWIGQIWVMGDFGVRIGVVPILEKFQKVMRRLAGPRFPLGDTAIVAKIEFFMGGGS